MQSTPIYLALAVALSLVASAASAAPWTYRGTLNDGGEPANGNYDLRVSLLSEGVDASIARPLTLYNVEVKNGRFTVDVDFGFDLANAPVMRLKTEVQQGGSGFVALGQPTRFDPKAALGSMCWDLSGNAGTDPLTNFIGTTDAQPLVLRTQNAQSLRIEPSAEQFGGMPITANVIAGSNANFVDVGVRGATIAGGGLPSGDSDPSFTNEAPNRVLDAYGTISGGINNRAGDGVGTATDSAFATVSGGVNNLASAEQSAIGGGGGNTASGGSSIISGGRFNNASGLRSSIGGGSNNFASADWSTTSGGQFNEAGGTHSVVGGGSTNMASALYSAVGGGLLNEATGRSSTVSGGQTNCAGGNYSWAGGFRAKIRPGNDPGDGTCVPDSGDFDGDEGSFVWADSEDSDFVSTGPDQFLVRAEGGFGLNAREIPPTVDLMLQHRASSGNGIVDFYMRTAAHTRGINMAMLPGAGAAQFRIAQYDGTTFTDRISLRSDGDFEVTADAFKPGGGAWSVSSDARLKTGVTPLDGALDRLLQLKSVEYTYLKPDPAKRPAGRHIGFIAQEVAKVFPGWVSTDNEGFLAVAPKGFEALAVQALRELSAENAALNAALAAVEARNAAMEARLRALESDR